MKKYIIVLILFFIHFINLYSYGGEPLAFLKNGAGARAISMGGAYASLSNDTAGVLYNPAGILKLKDLQLSAETSYLSFDRIVNFVSIGKPFSIYKNKYTLEFSWFNYSSGNNLEKRTTNSFSPEETFSDLSNIFIFSTATYLFENIYTGANFNIILYNIYTTKGVGMSFDYGLIYKIKSVNIGLYLRNISGNISWNNGYSETLPIILCGGVSYNLKINNSIIIFTFDAEYNTFDEKINPKTGMEINYNDFIFGRMGYNKTFSGGIGIKLRPSEIFSIKIDYAFYFDTMIETINHRIGFSMDYIFPHWGIEDSFSKNNGEDNKEDNDEW